MSGVARLDAAAPEPPAATPPAVSRPSAPPAGGIGPTAHRRLERQLLWMIGIRLIVITSVLLPAFLLDLSASQGGLAFPAVLSIAGLTYLASLLYLIAWVRAKRWLVAQAYTQFAGDLLVITLLMREAGGGSSPFSILYLVVISVAATLLRRRAGVLVATLAFVLYGLLLLGTQLGWETVAGARAEGPGSSRFFYLLVVHLLGFYGVALMSSFLARDVAQLQRYLDAASEDLAELEAFHRDVVESMNSGLMTTDRDGIVTRVNRVGLALLGAASTDPVGRPVFETGLVSESQWRTVTQRASDQRVRYETALDAGAETRWIGYSIGDLRDAHQQQLGFTVIFQDLTDWRRLREQVRIKERMAALGEMAASLAHEIGNPLAAISGSVQMLRRNAPPGTAQSKLLDITLKESRRLDRTIKDFLAFAKPGQHRVESFEITVLLQEHFELLRNSEEVGPQHRLSLRLDPPMATIDGDPDGISQVFWNLAQNALRAMPDGGSLRVEGIATDRGYTIRVSDSGRGMTDEERAKLFQPFQSFFHGSGIGMAIVYRIVEEHGGRIEVESAPGKGSTLSVLLPASPSGVESRTDAQMEQMVLP
ncbi:MAG TPA: ATP-binding protein [Thermoanaerobaculia bacterium]|nr:ATP-binding protein [Thermoanaerobaculia bacterium]